MTLRVYTNISRKQASPQGGIGQVVLALYKHLPKFDVQLVNNITDNIDVYTAHIVRGSNLPRIDVVHSHGLYFSDIPHLEYKGWHHNTNLDIVGGVREALVVTVPSQWVATPFRRDMRINPVVLGHGVDLDYWRHKETPKGYILYNKNREGDVCQSAPAWELAHAGFDVISTQRPVDKPNIPTLRVTGTLPHTEMRRIIQSASIYLATTLETFGIGTLEALASGVPVLGYRWGGNEDLVQHKINGYMVEPNNIQGLIEGREWIMSNWRTLSENAKQLSEKYDWEIVARKYAEFYHWVSQKRQRELENNGVSVIVTNYNYANWVEYAIKSALQQEVPPKEIIIVDDGSKDNSREVINKLIENYSGNIPIKKLYHKNMGVSYSRDRGISEASSPFVTCLDADDMLHPRFIKVLLPELQKHRELGIVYSGLQFMDERGKLGGVPSWPPEFDYNVQSSVSVPPSNVIPSGCMFRKSMWARSGGYRQEYAPGEDAEFWTRGLSCGFDAKKVTSKPLFWYRGHTGSASRTKKYHRIDDKMPWMRDGVLPMGAPSKQKRDIRSYLHPNVSVIIPVGPGHEKYVHFAIESVLGQTLRSWELIVVNDTNIPTDEFEKMFSRFPFLKIHHTFEKNGKRGNGAGVARNIGIESAEGDTIFFLDADDLLLPNALISHWEAIIETDFNRYIYAGHLLARNDTDDKFEEHVPEEYNQGQWRMQHSISVLMPTQWAKDLLFDEELDSWEDWDFFIRAAIQGYCGQKIEGTYLVYRLKSGGRRKSILMDSGDLNARGKLVLAELKKRYDKYYNGGIEMAGCCGGTKVSDEILRAKRLINKPNSQATQGVDSMANSKSVVRLEYIGRNMGSIGMKVPSGRIYRGGRGSTRDRFVNASLGDVDYLLKTGKWQLVGNLPEAQPPAQEEKKALTAEEVRQTAAKSLQTAKKDFESREGVIKVDENLETSELQARIDEITKEIESGNKSPSVKKDIVEEKPDSMVDDFLGEVLGEPKKDINAARIKDLTAINGISEATAKNIIVGQPYRDMKELLKVNGIGASKLSTIEKKFRVGENV